MQQEALILPADSPGFIDKLSGVLRVVCHSTIGNRIRLTVGLKKYLHVVRDNCECCNLALSADIVRISKRNQSRTSETHIGHRLAARARHTH